MDKRALFGISITAVAIAFVAGFLIGGYFVAKTEGWIGKITAFVVGEKDKVEDLVVCPEDVKECGEGIFVRRNSENGCEFYACPEDEKQGFGSEIEQKAALNGSLRFENITE